MQKTKISWADPVRVKLQCGLERAFSCLYDALDFLENEWPSRGGVLHRRAISQCSQALGRTLPVAIARETFIFACLEAGMPAVGDRRNRHDPLASRQRPQLEGARLNAADTRMALVLALG